MRRSRNPRYAMESLERRLSPSGVVPPVAADVSIPDTQDDDTTIADLVVDSSTTDDGTSAVDPTTPSPGPSSPVTPTDPGDPSDGTDPTPPTSPGTPSPDQPNSPNGPQTPSGQ